MTFLSRIPGREYFITLFIIGSALFLTFSIVIYRHYDDSTQLNAEVVTGYEIARQSRLLLASLVDMETGVRGYSLTGQPEYLEPYKQSRNTPFKHIMAIRTLTPGDIGFNEQLRQWARECETFQLMLDKQVAFHGQYTQEQFIASLAEQRIQMNSLRNSIESSIGARLEKLGQQIANAKSSHKMFLMILVSGTFIAIAAMLLITSVILAMIVRSKKANAQMELSEERFRTVMNGINDGVFDFNVPANSIYYSQAVKDMLGYTDAEFASTPEIFMLHMHPDDMEETLGVFERYKNREIPRYENVFRMLHKNGTWRWILSRGVGYWNENGVMTRLIGTHSDITEHKRREDELKQLNTELETYTYIASHDLRSPLVNMRGFARELELSLQTMNPIVQQMESKLDEAGQKILKEAFREDIPEALNFIVKAVERMDTLTTAVLDLTRIGKREYVRTSVDVTALMVKCVDVQAYEIAKNQIEVTYDTLPPIYTDSLALEQIFSNLLDNAVKYTQPGRAGKIHISAVSSATDITYSVQDNGRGIDPQDMKKIFEIFKRARNTDTVRGLGMGMAFVKATVRKLGGSIWCNSVLGEGTTFYVQLPRDMKKGDDHA